MGERDGAIWTAVAELPDSQRAAVLLRFAVDLRYREIGAALDISEEAARRRVSDALRTLRSAVPAGKEE
jgi:RNA polymerase sigma factor (sigma-70 family)